LLKICERHRIISSETRILSRPTFRYHCKRTETTSSIQRSEISDHGKSFSVYFSDPWGNRLEVTTYDHEAVQANM